MESEEPEIKSKQASKRDRTLLKEKYLMEYCVPIVDINECRNNYLVHNAIQKGVPSISYFKQKVDEQIGLVYNGINICVGGKKSKYCQVRFTGSSHCAIFGT